jgi:hypothetical protein
MAKRTYHSEGEGKDYWDGFSNQSDLLTVPAKSIYLSALSQKMTFQEWPNPRRWLKEKGQIPEDD